MAIIRDDLKRVIGYKAAYYTDIRPLVSFRTKMENGIMTKVNTTTMKEKKVCKVNLYENSTKPKFLSDIETLT